MFIGHLPAGYLAAVALESPLAKTGDLRTARLAFWSMIIASITPDLDMFYFYLVDNRATHHHLYWTHLPWFWCAVLAPVAALAVILKKKSVLVATAAIAGGAFLHLILDSIVGGIAWLSPFSSRLFYVMELQPRYGWWVWNFVLHWSFLLEVLVCAAAGLVFLKRRRLARSQ